jgi:molybdenum cofactor biosynthesis enzyme MoaA
MTLGDLQKFLHCTEVSGYFVEKLDITGPGEPLLWKNLREGLAMLRASPAIGSIHVVTNGLDLNRIDEDTWKCIDVLRVSVYPASAHIQPKLREAQLKHGSKIIIRNYETFRTAP